MRALKKLLGAALFGYAVVYTWLRLLMLGEGESVSEADNVIWHVVSALNPMVLGTTGGYLWNSARR